MRVTKSIDSIADLVTGLDDVAKEWNTIREEALTGALIAGGFTEQVLKRTPESKTDRYRDPYTKKKNPRYGNAALLKSMFYDPHNQKSANFFIQKRTNGVDVVFGPSASAGVDDYARAMHESKTPQGQVSQPYQVEVGKGDHKTTITRWTPGWSKASSGPKYIEKPWNDRRFETEAQTVKNIDAELKRRGLM